LTPLGKIYFEDLKHVVIDFLFLIVVILFVVAVLDIVIGVSNDAVNF